MDGHRRILNIGTGTMTSSVDQIKSKIDIVSLIGSYIKLDKAGANYKAKCPFHNEKTPSFFVSPDRGSYYCFGCHAKGDIFTFVQEFEGLDFVGALKVLAEKAGVTLDSYDRKEKTESERLYTILEQAVFFYQKQLSENPTALEYLHKRGVTDATIKNFRIGFAPLDWRQLHDFLISKGVAVKDMLAVGVIKQKEGEQKYYDTFRGRIMFPISDSAGRVVGFSGRILVADDKSPKYLNSPETVLFNKSEILFGLDKAKKNIRIKDYSILVEGQMDLIMLHQAGITNTVASSGTALTPEHLIKLRRLSNNLKMFFDGDDAGFAASNRAAKTALSLGMDLKLVSMPQGKDPADLVKEDMSLLKKILGDSKHIIDFYTDVLLTKGLDPRNLNYDLNQEIRKNVLPYVALLNNQIDKAYFIKSIMRKTFLNEEALWEDLKHVGTSQVSHIPSQTVSHNHSVRIDSIERRIIGVILWQKSLAEPTIETADMEKKFIDVVGEKAKEMMTEFEKDKESLLFETESYYNGTENISSDIHELMRGLEEEYLKKQLIDVMTLLREAERSRDSALILQHLEECQQISQKINTIKQNVHPKK